MFHPLTFIQLEIEVCFFIYLLSVGFFTDFENKWKNLVFSGLFICSSSLYILKLVENWASFFSPDLGFNGLRVWDLSPNLEGSLVFTWFIYLFCFFYLIYIYIYILILSFNIYIISDQALFFLYLPFIWFSMIFQN